MSVGLASVLLMLSVDTVVVCYNRVNVDAQHRRGSVVSASFIFTRPPEGSFRNTHVVTHVVSRHAPTPRLILFSRR